MSVRSSVQSKSDTAQLGQHGTKTIAVIGTGKMGGALINAIVAKGNAHVRATAHSSGRAEALAKKLGIDASTDNRAAVRGADLVLICVKPNQVREVLRELRPDIGANATVVSIATGVTTRDLEAAIGENIAVVRAMPNTAARIGKGMTAICGGRHASAGHVAIASELFGLMGRTAEVQESLMDAVTGLSASGPAFVYTMLEAMAEGGVRLGLARELATTLAAQAMLGAAAMVLETGDHPAMLKNEVTTPGGCTVEGLLELENGNIRATLIRAVAVTAHKAGTLARPAHGDATGEQTEEKRRDAAGAR